MAVLLMVGDPEVRRRLALALEADGIEPLIPTDLEQAGAIAASELPHLVVLDGNFPAECQRSFLRELRGAAATAWVPLVLLGAAGAATPPDPFVVAVLPKPVDPARLTAAVRDHVAPRPPVGWAIALDLDGGRVEGVVRAAHDRVIEVEVGAAAPVPSVPNTSATLRFRTEDRSELAYEARLRDPGDGGRITVLLGALREREQRRRHLRRSLALQVQVALPGAAPFAAWTRDLSLGGVRLAGVPADAAEGTRVGLEFVLNGYLAIGGVTGVVKRVHAGQGAAEWGVAFDPLPEVVQDQLLGLLFGEDPAGSLLQPRLLPVTRSPGAGFRPPGAASTG